MSDGDTFGLRLQLAREKSGVSLAWIAERTKVPVALWQAMERNDFSRWPGGIFARAYIRHYATLVGLDPGEVVDEFCRHFPNGDRRAGSLLREQAAIIGAASQYQDEPLPSGGDRRVESKAQPPPPASIPWTPVRERAAGVLGDLLILVLASAALAAMLGVGLLPAIGAVCLSYHVLGSVLLGSSPGLVAVSFLRKRPPRIARVRERHSHA
jgi:hypothetical protein